jgi:hypothetical protein
VNAASISPEFNPIMHRNKTTGLPARASLAPTRLSWLAGLEEAAITLLACPQTLGTQQFASGISSLTKLKAYLCRCRLPAKKLDDRQAGRPAVAVYEEYTTEQTNRPFICRSDTQRSFTEREPFILPIFHLAVMIGKGRLPQ